MVPRVTILTAGFNVTAFIPNYLAGIKAQKYPVLEVVFVDDGSTDNTAEVLQQGAKSHGPPFANLVILRQSNQGPHVAMNYGLQFATGDLILPVDADDMLLPGAVQAFVDAFISRPDADLVFADYRHIDEYNRVVPVPPKRRKWVRSPNLLNALLSYGMFIPAGAYCYRRHCLQFLPNGCFSPEYYAQNLEMLLHSAARGKCFYLPVETVQLTKRSDSRSNAKTLERLRRKVLGSARLQRAVARKYRVPLAVRTKLERRLIPLELDYYYLSNSRKEFLKTSFKALCLGVAKRKNVIQLLSLALPAVRQWVINRYFSGYDLRTTAIC